MTLRLKPVERDDVRPLINLKVTPDQDDFVAPNAQSLAQLHYETGGYAFALMDEDRYVGMIQVIDLREHRYLDPEEDANAVYVWRLLIDQNEQQKGFGTGAMRLIEEWAQSRGVPKMLIHAVPENAIALKLYEHLGYQRTGRLVDGEVELAKDVPGGNLQ